jgi:hypothetical protein
MAIWLAILDRRIDVLLLLLIPIGCVILILIPNLIFYSILKKHNLNKDVFLYGVGFASGGFTFFSLAAFLISMSSRVSIDAHNPLALLNENYALLALMFMWVPFTLLFYSYAIIFKNFKKINENTDSNISKIVLTLIALNAVFLLFELILCLAIIKLITTFVLIVLLLLGASILIYFFILAINSVIFGKNLFSLRILAWLPVLPSFILFIFWFAGWIGYAMP